MGEECRFGDGAGQLFKTFSPKIFPKSKEVFTAYEILCGRIYGIKTQE